MPLLLFTMEFLSLHVFACLCKLSLFRLLYITLLIPVPEMIQYDRGSVCRNWGVGIPYFHL